MKAIELRAQPRTLTGKHVKLLRRQDVVPGVVYGHNIDPVPVQFNTKELAHALKRAGSSATVQLAVEGTASPYLVIFRDVQHHPIRRGITHVDLQALSLTETVRVPVNVVVVGKSPAVEVLGGVLLQTLMELEIEALPMDLVPVIEVDISGLAEIGDSISVADLDIPETITVLNAPDATIVQVTFQAAEEAPTAAVEAVVEPVAAVVAPEDERKP
ncbi:MAG: 50S ribosomal protein L25 [Anaerolineae bacterium]|jgi:large subunit ribosomal protein L25|nr:50S ribosomal protein L25 [Anaerolineae bacterium]